MKDRSDFGEHAETFVTSCSGNRSGSIFVFSCVGYLDVTPVKVQRQFKEALHVVVFFKLIN